MGDIAVVIIGRNEGERLKRCVSSVAGRSDLVVYVDSGSTDASVRYANDQGIEVVELDMSIPFTAARARNTGFARVVEMRPGVEYVQFVDGDCELTSGWLPGAARELDSDVGVGVACGRLRERHPQASIYNRLCDLEWDAPLGVVEACGGIFMARRSAFESVGGFNDRLIAGEEPELCVRLRAKGWKVKRVPLEMAWHDSAMTRFGQWWKRASRGGHAAAEGVILHGVLGGKRSARMLARSMVWGAAAPLLFIIGLVAGWVYWPAWLGSGAVLGTYLLVAIRVWLGKRRQGVSSTDARLYALYCMLGKVPEAQGAARCFIQRAFGSRRGLIEYK
ncbi:MAG: glycosyltransferase family 2 protein [Phycisphaerales bacterium]|nr:glycosyltransferase family 2 protein [Phycisphaerales bacterium]